MYIYSSPLCFLIIGCEIFIGSYPAVKKIIKGSLTPQYKQKK